MSAASHRRYAALLFVLAWPLQADAKIADGVYSSICVSPETLDQGGFELRLTTINEIPNVVFWICEGGCQSYPTGDVIVKGNEISFVAQAVDENLKFDGVFDGNALMLSNAGWGRERLTRQRKYTPSNTYGDSEFPTPVKRCS